MSAKSKTLNDLFLHTLKDVRSADKHVAKALSKLGKAATAHELRQVFDALHDEGQAQGDRLDKVFELLGKKPHNLPCEAIQGMVAEAKAMVADFAESAAIDAGLIAAAQAMAHYRIARYGALRNWAADLGLNQAATLLQVTLDDNKKADQRLSDLAIGLNGHQKPARLAPAVAANKPLTLKMAALAGLQ